MTAFPYDKDADGIATVMIDMPGPVNVMNNDFTVGMTETFDRLAKEDGLTGVVLASGKKTFFAGGDVKGMAAAPGEGFNAYITEAIARGRVLMRSMEKLPVPVVAAINGAALGGGYELTLASNYRVAWDDPSVVIGLPEATLGLLPGGGGCVRMVKKFGIQKALPWLLSGRAVPAAKALEEGLIDELAPSVEALVPQAKAWILAHKDDPDAAVQPWDRKGYRLPGGGLETPAVRGFINYNAFRLFEETRGLLPNKQLIFDVAVEALKLDLDTALQIETRALVSCIVSPVTKNMMAANFLQLNEVKRGKSRPEGQPRTSFETIVVKGAGPAADALAETAAKAGVTVTSAPAKPGDLVIDLSADPRFARLYEDGDPGRSVIFHLVAAEAGAKLVEIGVGADSDDALVAKAFDLARQLRKTPIVVGGAGDLFVTRVAKAQASEAAAIVADGVTARRVGNLAKAIGLASIAIATDNATQTVAGAVPDADVKDRILFAAVIESLKCLEEGVLRSVAEGNIGTLLGIGAPVWTGGYIQFVNTYGLQRFIDRCDELASLYGERLKAPGIVAQKLAAGETFG